MEKKMENNNFYQLEGILHRIDEGQEFSKFFSKQEFIVLVRNAYQEKVYEDYIRFECVNNKMNELVGLHEGYKVCVSFTIQGKESKKEEFKGRFYNSLRALRVDVLEKVTTEERAADTKVTSEKDAIEGYMDQKKPDPDSLTPQKDDLPFILTIPLAIGFLINFMI